MVRRRPARVLALALAVAVVAGAAAYLLGRSHDDDGPAATEPSPSRVVSVRPLEGEAAAYAVIELEVFPRVPADADALTITDLDAIRARLGVPDLTSQDLMADRQAFWDRAEREAVLLTDGLLRADGSELWLDYDVSEDDVDWEARFSGPDGAGYVLGFRPDQDMAKVQAAVDAGVGPLAGATVLPNRHLLVKGVAEGGEPDWTRQSDLGVMLDPGESTYLRRGCIPFAEALGTDATVEDQDAVLAEHDVAGLDDVQAMAVSFGDDVATAWLGPGRDDLFDRADLVADWPTTGPIGFADGFTGDPAVDPKTGRIGFHVADPVAAATLTLTDILPFGVCNDATLLDEPTGL